LHESRLSSHDRQSPQRQDSLIKVFGELGLAETDGEAMGAEDGSWLTLGDSDGVDVGLPVLVGFILG